MTILRNLIERRALGDTDKELIPSRSAQTWAGVAVSESAALAQGTVFACIRLVSDGLMTLPVDAFQKTDPNTRRPVSPTPQLLIEPHPEMSRPEWMARCAVSMLTRGNIYGKVSTVDRLGYPTGILPVHADQTQVRRDKVTGVLWYRFGKDDWTRRWPFGEAWHVPGFCLPGSDVGLSPIGLARQSIGLTLAAEEMAGRLYSDNATPSGILQVPGKLNDPDAEKMKDRWEAAHGGKSRRPAVLSGGTTFEQVSMTPEDSQFLESRQWQTEELCRWFGVPPTLVGENTRQSSWAASVEAIGILFVTYGMMPLVVRMETALTKLLPTPQFVKVNVAGLMRADLKTRYEAYQVGVKNGWLSVNDIRLLEDMPPIEGGDTGKISLTEQVNAVTALIRAGFDPVAACLAVGLPPIGHLGLLPITLQKEEQFDADLALAKAEI